MSETLKRSNLRMIGIEEGEKTPGQSHRKHFQHNHRKNFSNLKKEMPIKVQKHTEQQRYWGRKQISFGTE